ncbi:hypothetical protein F8388_019770 [Cannabis sativa]|uniref:Uncharacterized protein n=1 Tax=Cannabis sativa TaxID=3483 RepID=A0A7J6EVM0_CANSA|nr:hypothetical protein F8388_019770 [Cannabis sativa]KAF4400368.1 hypothetical protein G4B88_018710 [Cannabis sativa]
MIPPPLNTRLNGRHREGGKGRGLLFTHRFSLSCSSPKYTRDEISLSLSDAYGNQSGYDSWKSEKHLCGREVQDRQEDVALKEMVFRISREAQEQEYQIGESS